MIAHLFDKKLTSKKYFFLVSIILVGIAVRLWYYFQNRSLWLDETYLANSIVSYDFKQLLTTPLLYYQKAPLGFLMLEKMSLTVFSASEFSLRLIPLLCSIGALLVFSKICQHFLKDTTIWLALITFSIAAPLIFHAAEAKQYSSELFATLLAISLYIKLEKEKINKTRLFGCAIGGALLIWFSYSVVFLLVAISIAVLLKKIKSKKASTYMPFLLCFSLWGLSFVINYYFFTYKHAASTWTVYWFDFYKNFMPFPPRNVEDLGWFFVRFYRVFDNPLGLLWNFSVSSESKFAPVLKMAFIPAGLLLLGGFYFFKKGKDVLFLFLTIVLTLIASGLKLYPLTDRFWVFLSPIFIILVSGGYEFIRSKKSLGKLHVVVAFVLVVGLVTNTFTAFKGDEFMKDKSSGLRQSLSYVNSKFEKDDILYVYWTAIPGFRVYNKLYPYSFVAKESVDFRSRTSNFEEYINSVKKDVLQYNSKRVWVMFNYIYQTDIGEPVDWPKWYFEGSEKPSDKVIAGLNKNWKLVNRYNFLDMQVVCFEIK